MAAFQRRSSGDGTAVARSTLEEFARSTLERNHYTVPWRSRAGEMAPRALAKASGGWGGCGCGGPRAWVAAGLGLDLGREAMPCTNLAYAPRFAASGFQPPMSISADQVGIQVQAFPTYSIPPKPSPCQQVATNRQWVPPPPFFLLGVKRLVCANSNIFTPISGGGGGGHTSPLLFSGPGNSCCHPTTR